ncbi:MAG: Uma2 family endonuclease [Afipia sp.]|nr:Uma2 family endonuclease [Afipia sp.]
MVAMVQKRYLSAEEFAAIAQSPEYAEKLIELVNGEIVEMSKPGGKHGIRAMSVGAQLHNFVMAHNLGWVTAAETGYILGRSPSGRDTVRGLDVAFVTRERAPDGLPDGLVPFAPDFAAEIISPGNSAADIHAKVRELLRAGTRLIWLFYPDTETVVVHTPPSDAQTLERDALLDGGDVLPGFTLAAKDIFDV